MLNVEWRALGWLLGHFLLDVGFADEPGHDWALALVLICLLAKLAHGGLVGNVLGALLFDPLGHWAGALALLSEFNVEWLAVTVQELESTPMSVNIGVWE